MTYSCLSLLIATALAAAGLIATAGSAEAGPSLITNVNFGAGPAGFTSDYAVPASPACILGQAASCLVPVGTMFVMTGPDPDQPSWGSFGAWPGTGSPNMLIVNRGGNASQAVWRPDGVAFAPDSAYQFAAYQFTGFAAGSDKTNRAILQLLFNGATARAAYAVSATPGAWGEFTYDWYSGSATSLNLTLLEVEKTANGNDFSLHNLSLGVLNVAEPASAAALVVGMTVIIVARKRRRRAPR